MYIVYIVYIVYICGCLWEWERIFTLCTSVVVYETMKEVERDGDGRRKKDQLQMFDQVSIDFINSILAWTIFEFWRFCKFWYLLEITNRLMLTRPFDHSHFIQGLEFIWCKIIIYVTVTFSSIYIQSLRILIILLILKYYSPRLVCWAVSDKRKQLSPSWTDLAQLFLWWLLWFHEKVYSRFCSKII